MKRKGFTLIEIMIVVAIISILAAVAIPGFRAYIDDAAKSEANTTLIDIAAKQAAYFSAWGEYKNVSDGWDIAAAPDRTRKDQGIASSDAWKQLGFDPGGPTYWSYATFTNATNSSYAVCAVRKLGGKVEFAVLLDTNRRNVLFQEALPARCQK